MTIDTLQLSQSLKNAGMPETQADAVAAAISEALNEKQTDSVTRDYLDSKITELKTDLQRWVIGFLIAQSAIVLGSMYFLIRHFGH